MYILKYISLLANPNEQLSKFDEFFTNFPDHGDMKVNDFFHLKTKQYVIYFETKN